jgi:hypothetical protein
MSLPVRTAPPTPQEAFPTESEAEGEDGEVSDGSAYDVDAPAPEVGQHFCSLPGNLQQYKH